MSFKVVHVVDYYIQETMNWLEELLQSSKNDVEHIIAAEYFSNENFSFKKLEGFGINANYPPNLINRIGSKVRHITKSNLLKNYIIKTSVDAIHFHFGHMGIRYLNVIESLPCKKFISLYGFDYEYLIQSKPETLVQYLELARLNVIFIVEGSYSKRLLESYHIPSQQIKIVQMFYKRDRLINYLPIRPPFQLFQASSYTEKKGHLTLLEALSLNKHNNLFHIQFNGEVMDIGYFKEINRVIKFNKLNGVTLGPKISLNTYLNRIIQSHAIISLSRKAESGDTEGGCPVIIKDAFALAKPVLTTLHCDITDIAIHNYNSWLIKENDVQSCCEILNIFQRLSDKDYRYFCKSAYETALQKTNSEWTKIKLLETYTSCLD